MVEIIQVPIGESGSLLNTLWSFIPPWWFLLMVLGLVILVVVVYYLLRKLEEERKERDDILYEEYKNVIRDCGVNRNKKKIRKHYRWINLLWLGLPVLWKEHSCKILNVNRELIGFYRGESQRMEGTINYLVYKDHWFGCWGEKKFILKVPLLLKSSVVKTDVKNKQVFDELTKKPVMEEVVLDFTSYVINEANGDVLLQCTHIERLGQYYSYPIFVYKSTPFDIRPSINRVLNDNTMQNMVQRILADGAKQVEAAFKHNPYLVYAQKEPEKTKELPG